MNFHPTFEALLKKLKDPRLSIRDLWPERNAWHKAGCPIDQVSKPDTAWDIAYRCYLTEKDLNG